MTAVDLNAIRTRLELAGKPSAENLVELDRIQDAAHEIVTADAPALLDLVEELQARIEAADDRLRSEFHAPLYVGSRAMTAVGETLNLLAGSPDGADA